MQEEPQEVSMHGEPQEVSMQGEPQEVVGKHAADGGARCDLMKSRKEGPHGGGRVCRMWQAGLVPNMEGANMEVRKGA